MTLSQDEFNRQCLEFVHNQPDDSWCLGIKRLNKSLVKLTPGKLDIEQQLEDDGKLILIKEERRRLPGNQKICNYEYTVIYSESFEVPVMYFCVSDQNGAHVSLTDVITTRHKDLTMVVNQVEHPLLFRPFYMIHPCRTKDFMEAHVANNPKVYLISWLSSVATLFDLKLDPRLGHLSHLT